MWLVAVDGKWGAPVDVEYESIVDPIEKSSAQLLRVPLTEVCVRRNRTGPCYAFGLSAALFKLIAGNNEQVRFRMPP